ncbi:hypothetical protein GCM10007063_32500 [Lentibacillus kapialis]|uniref:Uncharacterized protein n=1 Tax=Lentibacillus kapialis TaxID=340214 RepID=A0A917Q2I7_9BACI|nr:hypothetical protein [Lentibacillus kapialis]GGK07492.1 hypothetical protein GCM10007063_32500 [Lentibacillus kapialis]
MDNEDVKHAKVAVKYEDVIPPKDKSGEKFGVGALISDKSEEVFFDGGSACSSSSSGGGGGGSTNMVPHEKNNFNS